MTTTRPLTLMLPSQILLNNLLYDSLQLAIPTDRVDPEQVQAPSHWHRYIVRHIRDSNGQGSGPHVRLMRNVPGFVAA